jgi:uncharacterized protein with HEPN domain
MRDSSLYIRDIIAAISSITAFIGEMDFTAFSSDDKTQSAVIRKLEIIGEAVKQMPDDVRRQYPDIPWKQIAGMRDKLIHFYFGVDTNLIWQTVHNRLPALKTTLLQHLDDMALENDRVTRVPSSKAP